MKLRYLQIASSICITCCHLGMSHPALASQTYSKMLTKEYVVTKKGQRIFLVGNLSFKRIA